jgi:hypothetical protein
MGGSATYIKSQAECNAANEDNEENIEKKGVEPAKETVAVI